MDPKFLPGTSDRSSGDPPLEHSNFYDFAEIESRSTSRCSSGPGPFQEETETDFLAQTLWGFTLPETNIAPENGWLEY